MANESETPEIKAMRSMAWQRAKGEMRSMMETYWPDYDSVYNHDGLSGKFEHFKDLFDNFVDEVEVYELDR